MNVEGDGIRICMEKEFTGGGVGKVVGRGEK